MKKLIVLILCTALALTVCAHAEEDLFDTLSGLSWTFCSGVGGWSTDLEIDPDGSFTGDFHDSEMGDTAEDYPLGTVYYCSFSGQMRLEGQVDENTWRIRIESLDFEQEEESIADEIRYVPAEPYGLSEGDEMLLYRPGTPVGVLSEDMLFWAHALALDTPSDALEHWFLSSEKNDSGFVGYEPVSDGPEDQEIGGYEAYERSVLIDGVYYTLGESTLRDFERGGWAWTRTADGRFAFEVTEEGNDFYVRTDSGQPDGKLTQVDLFCAYEISYEYLGFGFDLAYDPAAETDIYAWVEEVYGGDYTDEGVLYARTPVHGGTLLMEVCEGALRLTLE